MRYLHLLSMRNKNDVEQRQLSAQMSNMQRETSRLDLELLRKRFDLREAEIIFWVFNLEEVKEKRARTHNVV